MQQAATKPPRIRSGTGANTPDTGEEEVAMDTAVSHEAARLPPAADTVFRLLGAVLQIASTLVLARTLSIDDTGLFFQGFVVTIAGATFMRAKFDLYISRHIVGRLDRDTGLSIADVLQVLSRRFMTRCCIICAVLLVIAADLDVTSQYLKPYLQTFVPFVIALPLAGYATMISSALRAANRWLQSLACTAYALNSAIVLVALVVPQPSLQLFSWTFLAGSALGAGLAWLFARRLFGQPRQDADACARIQAWKTINRSIHDDAGIGIANAVLTWGPLCLLVALAPAREMALYAIGTRTAQLIVYLMPALAHLTAPRTDRELERLGGQHGRAALRLSLIGLAIPTAIVAVVLLAGSRWTLAQYGTPYETAFAVYLVLIVAEGFGAAIRPMFRHRAANWDADIARRMLYAASATAIAICLAGIAIKPALAAAIAFLTGHLVAAVLALRALRRP
jgi:O-antigen/teichoic acid export membrane protein